MQGGGTGKRPRFAERLLAARQRTELSQEGLAAEIGVSQSTVAHLEAGRPGSAGTQAKAGGWLAVQEAVFAAAEAAAAAGMPGVAARVEASARMPFGGARRRAGTASDCGAARSTYRCELDLMLNSAVSYLPVSAAQRLEEMRLQAIRRWLFTFTAEDAEQRAFVEYLRAIAQRLDNGWRKSRPRGLWWQALKTLAPIAESGWWVGCSAVEVRLGPNDRKLLCRVREGRRWWWSDRRRWPGAAAARVELLAVVLRGLEICLLTGDRRGRTACVGLAEEVRRSLGAGSAATFSAKW